MVFFGKVTRGLHIGKSIGFPTINIEVPENKPLFEFGIYACEVELKGNLYKGVMHYGPKTIGTDDKNKIFCEIHLFDFDEDAYYENVRIKLLKKIREVRKFSSVTALKKQISKDIETTKKHFNAQ